MLQTVNRTVYMESEVAQKRLYLQIWFSQAVLKQKPNCLTELACTDFRLAKDSIVEITSCAGQCSHERIVEVCRFRKEFL